MNGAFSKERSARYHAAAQCSVKQHWQNLEMLARTLQSLGLGERDIGPNAVAAFEEYERELLHTLGEMMGESC